MSSLNLVSRILNRQVSDGPAGSQIARHRRLYENIVPNDQATNVEPPDCHICKFLPSGNLVCFDSMQHEIAVFSYRGPFTCLKAEQGSISHDEGLAFSQFFKLKYRRIVTHGAESLCRDLCLAARQERFLIVASCSTPIAAAQAAGSSTSGLGSIPLVASTTFHVVDAESGDTVGNYSIFDDFIHLSHANGVYLLDDRLCILAVRSQTIHILHITPKGQLLVVHKLGEHCHDDDELELAKYEAAEAAWLISRQQKGSAPDLEDERRMSHQEAGPGHMSQPAEPLNGMQSPALTILSRVSDGMQRAASAPLPLEPPWLHVLETAGQHRRSRQPGVAPPNPTMHRSQEQQTRQAQGSKLITGIRQRVMAYLYLQGLQQKGDDSRRKLMVHFEDFASLAMWKVQMLDCEHLLISMGPPDASVQRDLGSSASHSFCLLVWSLPQARVIDLHHVGSRNLLHLYQTHWHMFHRGCMVSPWHQFLSPPSGCRAPVTQITPSSAVRRVLTNLPASSQLLSPSPYLDLTLFQYDEKHMSAMVRPRIFQEQPLKFFARVRSDRPRFKIQAAAGDVQQRFNRQFVAHHFHPFLPLVLCIVQNYVEQPQLTIFLRAQ